MSSPEPFGSTYQPLAIPSTTVGSPSDVPLSSFASHPVLWLWLSTSQNGLVGCETFRSYETAPESVMRTFGAADPEPAGAGVAPCPSNASVRGRAAGRGGQAQPVEVEARVEPGRRARDVRPGPESRARRRRGRTARRRGAPRCSAVVVSPVSRMPTGLPSTVRRSVRHAPATAAASGATCDARDADLGERRRAARAVTG